MFKKSQTFLFLLVSIFPFFLEARELCKRESAQLQDGEFGVKLSVYRPEKPGEAAIIIMPPTGGINFIDKSYAWNLCDAGFDAYIIERWTGDDEQNPELEIHQRLYERAQKAMALVRNQAKTKYVGLLGTSVGALHVAVSVGVGLNVDAAFVVTGGAPIPSIIVDSDQQAMVDVKQTRKEKYGFKNDEEYLAALSKVFHFDPLTLPNKNIHLGMVIATEDSTVPTKYQQELQKAWNPLTVYEFANGHMFAIVRTWMWHRKAVVAFFLKSLQTKR